MELDIAVSFHYIKVKDKSGKAVLSTDIQNMLIDGFKRLQTDNSVLQQQLFKDYGLYVAQLETNGTKCYMFVQDSRNGYAEKIYKPSNEVISTNKYDTRSRKFFVGLDFSNPNLFYICNSYMGQFGCFSSIQKAIKKILCEYKVDIYPIIVNSDFSHYLEKGKIRNIEVTHYKQIDDIAEAPWYKAKGTFHLSSASCGKSGKDLFSKNIKEFFSEPSYAKRVSLLLNKFGLTNPEDKIAISGAEITSQQLGNVYIKLYVNIDGRVRAIDFMKGSSSLATRFFVNECARDQDNDPIFENIKVKSDDILDTHLKNRIN